MPEVYPLLQFTHILLFVYWLGADLGVFLASEYVSRSDLTFDERKRFLELLLSLDMGPRTALVMVIPTGTLMIWLAKWIEIRTDIAALIVTLPLFWLSLVWYLHRNSATHQRWQQLDMGFRSAVVALMVLLGIRIVTGNLAEAPAWLGFKFLAYAGAVFCGIMLRRVLRIWARGFRELSDTATIEKGNIRIASAAISASRYAVVLWMFVLLAAFFGVYKPIGVF